MLTNRVKIYSLPEVQTEPDKDELLKTALLHNKILGILVLFCIISFSLIAAAIEGTYLGWRPNTCLPDNCYCEQPLDTTYLIRQPSNTWSNLAFTCAGIMVLLDKKFPENPYVDRKNYRTFVVVFGTSLVVQSTWSGFFHASLTFFAGGLDVQGNYLILGSALVFNFVRLGWIGQTGFYIIFIILNIILGILQYYLVQLSLLMFGIFTGSYILFELIILHCVKLNNTIKSSYLYLGLVIFAIAFTIWNLDGSKIICSPDNHILQGHAIWHLMMAGSFYCIYLYHRSEQHAFTYTTVIQTELV